MIKTARDITIPKGTEVTEMDRGRLRTLAHQPRYALTVKLNNDHQGILLVNADSGGLLIESGIFEVKN